MAHGTAADASSAASGGTVPSEVSAVLISSMQLEKKGASQTSEQTKYVRNCARTPEGLEQQVDVALALCLVQRADHLRLGE